MIRYKKMPYPLDVAGLHCIIEQLSCPYVIATVKPSKHLIQMPCFYNIISNISIPSRRFKSPQVYKPHKQPPHTDVPLT